MRLCLPHPERRQETDAAGDRHPSQNASRSFSKSLIGTARNSRNFTPNRGVTLIATMARKRSTLVLVIAGIIVCTVMLFAGVLVWFFTSALERSPADQATADARFQELRGRFRGVTPLFEMGPNGPVLKRQPPPKPATGRLRSLEMLGWDGNDEELARVTIPFWMIRMKPGNINVSSNDQERSVRLSLSADDLEDYGPTLLLDHTDEEGYHLVLWTE